MNDIAILITALIPLLTLGGGAIAWFLRRIDQRVAAAESAVKECEKHRDQDEATLAKLRFEVHRDGMAIRMLASELHRVDPVNPTLNNVATILRKTFDPELAIPEDFAELLARIGPHPAGASL